MQAAKKRRAPHAHSQQSTKQNDRVDADALSLCNQRIAHSVANGVDDARMAFGGVGPSGMGAYHGEWGFQAMSHRKAVLAKTTKPDLKLLYPPYTERARWLAAVAAWSKLGHPVPESNFASELNSLAPQPAHR